MARVVQLTNGATRRIALVDEPGLRLVDGVSSIYELATLATETGDALSGLVQGRANGTVLDYDEVYAGRGPWRLMPPIDHPAEPARCIVSGTGLTHFGSARDRNAMHVGAQAAELTDSLRMFQAGVEHGRPAPGEVGVAPEWFYKGVGTMLRGHDDALVVPRFAEGGGEEAEIAGVYVIAGDGTPCRVGLAAGSTRTVFRSGRPKPSKRMHITSPSSSVMPSPKLSECAPKKWTWTSPGRRCASNLK